MTEDFEKMIGAAEENTKYAMPPLRSPGVHPKTSTK